MLDFTIIPFLFVIDEIVFKIQNFIFKTVATVPFLNNYLKDVFFYEKNISFVVSFNYICKNYVLSYCCKFYV